MLLELIYIYYGRPGSGKSLCAVNLAYTSAIKGRRVLSNFHPAGHRYWKYALWQEMIGESNALCIVDEAQMWFSARNWQAQTVEDLGVFQQSRKSGLDLVVVVQHHRRLDVAIRELAHWYVRHNRIGRIVMQRYHTQEETTRYAKTKFTVLNPELTGLYWTAEIIGNREGRGVRIGNTSEYGGLMVRASTRAATIYRPASDGPALATHGWRCQYGYLRRGIFAELPEALSAPLAATEVPAPPHGNTGVEKPVGRNGRVRSAR